METPAALGGRYTFTAQIGEGQGQTWRARRNTDDLEVIVKVLDLSKIDAWKALELFEREAKALAGLDLPGVPALVEYIRDEDGDGRFYIIQEYIPGESLQARMARGARFDEPEVIVIARAVLSILEALHQRRPPIIHRDLKPANIILRPDGACALVDFGAVTDALRRDASESGDTVAGTFGYMPPEQFHGQATPSSDLYALGATMVHLLAGKPPSSMESHLFRLDFRPHVRASVGLLAVLERLLEPDLNARFEHAVDVQGALEAVARRPELRPTNDALPVTTAQSFKDLKVVGQPGSMTLFHAAPSPPRAIPAVYRQRLNAAVTLWFAGGGVVALAAALIPSGLLGIATEALIFIALLPFVFAIDAFRRSRTVRALLSRGHKAMAEVSAAREMAEHTEVRYRFEVGGQKISGVIRLKVRVALEKGDAIGVLYLAEDPSTNMIHPLPAAALLSVGEE